MDLILILALMIINGLLALTEMALVSSRKSKLEGMVRKGDTRAAKALKLAEHPGNLFSMVQLGLTLISILSGVFAEQSLANRIEVHLQNWSAIAQYSHQLSIFITVSLVTFGMIVIGELVPKKIGLTYPEKISRISAGFAEKGIKLTSPLVWLLNQSANGIIRLLGIKPNADSVVTEDEIKAMVEEGTSAGTIDVIEQEIVENVFHLGDRKISSLMTPKPDIIFLDLDDDPQENWLLIRDHKHSCYPVIKGGPENISGIILIKNLIIEGGVRDALKDLKRFITEPLYVPEQSKAFHVLEMFREHKKHQALVIDEYGSIAGLVTINDILDAIVGDMSISGEFDYEVTKREDGSFLIDAAMPFEEFCAYFQQDPEKFRQGSFVTVGGFVLEKLRRIPKAGDSFVWQNFQIEVIDMDRARIDKLLVKKLHLD